MASCGSYDYRSPTKSDLFDFPLVDFLKQGGYDPKILELELYQESPDSETEIRESFTDILNGVASPVKLDVRSSDNTNDKAAGTGALTVKLLGISATTAAGTFSIFEETITLNGTTHVTTARYYKRLIAVKTATWGSGGKAAGTITVSEVGGETKTYAAYANTSYGTVNARVYIPTNYTGRLQQLYANVIQAAGAAAAVLDAGCLVRIQRFTATGVNLKADLVLHRYSVLPKQQLHIPPHWEDLAGDDYAYFTVFLQTVNTGANKDCHIDLKFVIWQTTTSKSI